jgi:flagellar basal body-associated protein FliL
MSEAVAEKKEEAPAARGGGNKKLLIIVLAVNVLLAGGLGYFVISSRHAADGAAAAKPAKKGHAKAAEGEGHEKGGEEEAEEEPEEGKDAKHGRFGPLLDLGSFVANLSSVPGQPARYAKVSLSAEALNEDAKVRVEAGLVPLKSEALMLLSSLKADDLTGQEKILAVADELLKRCNKLLGEKSIKKVYFSELVVQ